MTDLANDVRALCTHDVSGFCDCVAQQGADKIEQFEKLLDHYIGVWSDVCDENQGLRNEIERLEKQVAHNYKNAMECTTLLAESQAREAKLRDFIFDYVDIEPNNERMIARYETCVKPTDDTALKEFKRKVLMDAAAQLCTQRNSIPATGHEFANVLRILAEEVLK